MAEQHLGAYPSAEITQTGSEFILGVQSLWTGGRSSISSRALSLINAGSGISVYADGNWTDTNTFTWPGGGGWDKTWISDDKKTTVHSVQVEPIFNKKNWQNNGTHEIIAGNGDIYQSTFYYTSKHKLNAENYIGGDYSGGHSITFNGLAGTPDDSSDDEIVSEQIKWTSTVSFTEDGRNDEIKNQEFDLSYENAEYKLSWDASLDMNWGLASEVTPLYAKFDASEQFVFKNVREIFETYSFEDKSTGFKFRCSAEVVGDFIKNSATLKFTNVTLVQNGVEYKTRLLNLSMTAAQLDQISLGEEIGDDLGGIEGNITTNVLPFVEWVTDSAIEKNNIITINTATTSAILADAGNDTVNGSKGNDEIDGEDGADKLFGGNGDDDLSGGAGTDLLDGGKGDDLLYSGDGNDTVAGGDGNDTLVGGDGAGNDMYDGGKGIDTVRYTSAMASITVDLSQGKAASTFRANDAGIGKDQVKNIENIIGGDFADRLTGSKAANYIVGGAGNDTIDGGLGSDTLVGGDGADVFVFSTKPAVNNLDTIDFQAGIDKLRLSSTVFDKLKGTTDFLAFGATSDSATHYLVYNRATGKLSYDADGNDTKAPLVNVAIIGTGLTLSTSDFVIA